MGTSETAANQPVWNDRKLIRIILHQKKEKNWIIARESSSVVFVFGHEGLFRWLIVKPFH